MARRQLTERPLVVWAAWFLGLWLVAATWSLAVGRYGGPDEPAHVVRAYAVAHGEVRGTPTDDLASGYRVMTVPAQLGTGDPACYRFDPTVTDACAAATGSEAMVRVASAAGINPPLYYALVGWPVRLLGVADEVITYRLVAAMWVSAVLALAALRLRRHRERAMIGLVALPPSVWFLFGVVNPNALEIALVGLAWACVVPTGSTRLARGDLIVAGLALAVAVAVRPIAFVAAVTVGAVAWSLDRRARRDRPGVAQAGRSDLVMALAPLMVAVLSVVAWHRWADVEVADSRTATDASTWTALRDSVGGLPRTAAELVASLGWLEFWVPLLAVGVWAAALGLAVARSRPIGPPLWVWGAGISVTPVVFEVVVADEIGLIWQGRYSVPVFLGIGALCLASAREWRLPRATLLMVASVELIAFWWTLRRYRVGTGGPLLPDRHGLLLLLANLVAVAGGALVWHRWRRAPSPEVAEHVDDHV